MYRNFLRNNTITVPQINQPHTNYSTIPNTPYQQQNYQSPQPQPSVSSLTSINQKSYPSQSPHLPSFSSFPKQAYQQVGFMSTPAHQSASYPPGPITDQEYFNESDDTIQSI